MSKIADLHQFQNMIFFLRRFNKCTFGKIFVEEIADFPSISKYELFVIEVQ